MTKKTRHSNNQQSTIKSHPLVSDSYRELYKDDVFSVLAHGRSVFYLSVLEALYIRKLSPVLCVQKDNVCHFSCLVLILVKVSGMFLLTDVFVMF